MRHIASIAGTSLFCLLIGCSHPTTSARTPAPTQTAGTAATRPAEPDLATEQLATSQDAPEKSSYISPRTSQLNTPGDHCPDGHTTLKDVPIVYGLLLIDTPEKQKNLATAIKNYEIWPGGCVSTSASPRVRITCTTCGFGFDAEFGLWSRSSTDPTSFIRPLSAETLSFPKPASEHLKEAIEYHQSINEHEVILESMNYTSTQARKELITGIVQWFKSFGEEPPPWDEDEVTDLGKSEELLTRWQTTGLTVMLKHNKKEREFWVMLTVNRRARDIEDKLKRDFGTAPLPPEQ